jgi:hypothetical protein
MATTAAAAKVATAVLSDGTMGERVDRPGYPRGIGSISSGQFLAAFALAAAAGTATFFHAERNRIRHASAWASFVFLFLIVGLPTYLVHVRRVRRNRLERD